MFRDVQDKIRRQAKQIGDTLGDEMEKSGKQAGERSGRAMGQGLETELEKSTKKATGELEKTLRKTVADISNDLKPINLRFENNEATARIKKLREDFAGFQAQLDKGVNPKGLNKMASKLQIINAEIGDMDEGLSDVAKHDFAKVQASLGRLQNKLEGVQRAAEIEVRVELEQAERALGSFERKVKTSAMKAARALGDSMDPRIAKLRNDLEHLAVADIDSKKAEAKLRELTLRARELSQKSVDIQVKADAGAAAAEMLAMYALVRELDGKDVDIKVDVNDKGAISKLAGIKAAVLGTGSGGEEASNAFRSFNAVILAAVTLIPALIPVLAALGGGLLALGPIAIGAGAGIGAMVIGFSGITTAVQAFSQQQKRSAADSQASAAAIRSALYSLRDAQRAVGDAERQSARTAVDSARAVAQARQSAAESIRSALESQRQAQEAYANSVLSVKDAEEALTKARQDARQQRQSNKNAIADNALATRQAVLSAFDATNTLNQTMADGSSTHYDKAAAKLAYDQAQQQLKELRQQGRELAKEKKKQDKEGINGTDAVQKAQEAVTKALQSQRDAQIAVGDAARKVDQARVQGAQAIQQALLQQSRAEEDGNRAVARAKEQVTRAQLAYNEALKKNNQIGSAADQNVRAALQNLGPAGREFARFIAQLQQGFYDFRAKVQAALLPPVQHAIERIINRYGPQLQDFFVTMAGAAGKFFTQVSKAFDSKAFQHFGRVFDKLSPALFNLFGKTTIAWLKIFASLMTAAAPFSLILARGMLRMSDALSRWLESKKGREGVQNFMEYAYQVGPQVVDFLANFVKAAVNLAKALAPWGGVVLKALDGFFRLLASIPPEDLGLITTALLGLFIAFQVGVGVSSALLGGLALLASPIGLIAAATIAAVIVFTALYVRFKLVRQITAIWFKALGLYIKINYLFYRAVFKVVVAIVEWVAKFLHLKQIGTAVFDWLKRVIPPIVDAVIRGFKRAGDAIVDFWENYAKPALAKFGDVLKWLYDHIAKPILHAIGVAFRVMGRIIKAIWNGFIWPVLDLMIHVFTRLITKVWVPLISMVLRHFRDLGKGIKTAWEDVIKPILGWFGDRINWLWKKVAKPILGWLADRWKTFANGMEWVYDHTIKPIIDAFVDAMGGPQGLKSKFHAVVDAIGEMWGNLKRLLAAPVKFVLDGILNHGLIAGFNKVAKFVGSKPMAEIPLPKALQFARGGVLPGYTPGRDVHRFRSPTGGGLDLSGGEAIMRPEFTRAVGPGFVNYMNTLAASGGVKAVERAMGMATGGIVQRFAKGGVLKNPDARVSMDGKNIAAIAAAQLLLAERLMNKDYSIMQGSMAWGGHAVAASGSSHNYPGVADIATAGLSFADQTALRRVGFAAWARNIPGAAYVGSGAHVHSVSMLSPGTNASPQIGDYLGGSNGLNGGPDYGPRPKLMPGLAAALGGFDLSKIDPGGKGSHGFGLPSWVMSIAKNPIGWAAGLVTKPIKAFYDKFGSSDFAHAVAGFPMHLVKGVAEKAISYIPGGGAIMKAAGFAFDKVSNVGHFLGDGAHSVVDGISNVGSSVGDVLGFARGGVLPYNGTMKYDAGGYLPPGLTSVVNLTGKPEPVFTHDQFEGGMAGRGGLHYAPTFVGSDLTAEDVMDDLEFTYRKMSRSSTGGRYAGARS